MAIIASREFQHLVLICQHLLTANISDTYFDKVFILIIRARFRDCRLFTFATINCAIFNIQGGREGPEQIIYMYNSASGVNII